jgi:hypothetical protein
MCVHQLMETVGGGGEGCDTLYVMHVCIVVQYIIHNIQYIASPQTSYRSSMRKQVQRHFFTSIRLSIRLYACTRKRVEVFVFGEISFEISNIIYSISLNTLSIFQGRLERKLL